MMLNKKRTVETVRFCFQLPSPSGPLRFLLAAGGEGESEEEVAYG